MRNLENPDCPAALILPDTAHLQSKYETIEYTDFAPGVLLFNYLRTYLGQEQVDVAWGVFVELLIDTCKPEKTTEIEALRNAVRSTFLLILDLH